MREAAREVGPPLFFSLLIITLSFLPVFTLQAQEGKLFAPLAYTKTFAMAAAAGLSITLVPVLMGYFIRGHIIPESRNPIDRVLIAGYRPVIGMILKAPGTVLAVALLLTADHAVAGHAPRLRIHAGPRRGRPAVHAQHLPGGVHRQGAGDPAADRQADPRPCPR